MNKGHCEQSVADSKEHRKLRRWTCMVYGQEVRGNWDWQRKMNSTKGPVYSTKGPGNTFLGRTCSEPSMLQGTQNMVPMLAEQEWG